MDGLKVDTPPSTTILNPKLMSQTITLTPETNQRVEELVSFKETQPLTAHTLTNKSEIKANEAQLSSCTNSIKSDINTKETQPPAAERDSTKTDTKEQNGVSREGKDGVVKQKVKAEDSDEDLKKFNRKVPKERSAVKKDEIDAHYDRLPWVIGALGRIFHLGISHGPHFAPINIPFSRRKETFAVLFWMSTFLFMGAGSLLILLYVFFYTQYWWMSLCYLTWFIGDRSICNRGGRRIEWVRRHPLWKHYRNFFPIHLIKTAELDPSKNYIMGYHPHGILSAGAVCHFATEGSNFSKIFPDLTPHLLTLEGHFLLPFYREFFMASGAVSATRESMDYLLGREGSGRALCLVVGGAKESLDCHPGTVVLHLKKRKGFCKMALRHGASLVPMFSFGENEIYDQVANPEGSLIRRFQNSLQTIIGLAPCMFTGRGVFQYSFGIVPFRKPIYTVVGTPIDVPYVKNPTKEQIVGLHETYVHAVIDLYNKYKHKYSEFPECDIKIV